MGTSAKRCADSYVTSELLCINGSDTLELEYCTDPLCKVLSADNKVEYERVW